MGKLKPGLYEQIINKGIEDELRAIPENMKYSGKIDKEEASGILSKYVAEIVKHKLDEIADETKDVTEQVQLVNDIIRNLGGAYDDVVCTDDAQQLLALLPDNDPMGLSGNKDAKNIVRPETSVAYSSLFTSAPDEPQMLAEIKKEIETADRIDMLVSFVKWSGLVRIMDELRAFTDRGGVLRVITTSYIGATEVRAVNELSKLSNTEVKVSYDTKRTRLHAKAYVFYRESGFSTAYIGSSNMSVAAMTYGLEWNVKATEKDMYPILQKVEHTFESYWNSKEFELYDISQEQKLRSALGKERKLEDANNTQYFFDINPYSYQQEILDKLQAEREVRGKYRNLVVAATGTGKTLISAFDYRRYCQNSDGKKRLLFVAHREEILEQSRAVFRAVLRDPNFGELYVGANRPEDNMDYLFVSVQTMASKKLYEVLPEDYYSYIIVDEFHHAAAPTYQAFMDCFKPEILLGLTATPERMDGKNVLDYFGGRIAAEIRLPEAIDRELLCPFQYFGVSDNVDLSELKWTRGGYDKGELSNLYSFSTVIAKNRAGHIVDSVLKYVSDINNVHGLGFCVSIAHAKFMADYFNGRGIDSIALDGNTKDSIRQSARQKLIAGEIKFIFVVDLYNEGVDIPEVDTILFLRPTESLTIFLQQLGRGLRRCEGKDCLTVLDFIGQANRRYNFEEKFAALLDNSSTSVPREIKRGFVSVPKGCYIQLEKKASRVILENIRKSLGEKSGLVNRIGCFEEETGKELSLDSFLTHYHLPLKTIYKKYSFSRLCVEAGVRADYAEPLEEALTKSFGRFVSTDSKRWIEFLIETLPSVSIEQVKQMNELEQRMMQMFYVTVWDKYADWESEEAIKNLCDLQKSPTMVGELVDILTYNLEHIDFVDKSVDLGFDCPLDVYCSYTREQLLVALDYKTPKSVMEGVTWLPEKKLDVFRITINKSDKEYSPSTMYKDYSINEELFHWQSQNKTSDHTPTGKRYINHKSMGSKVLLFVREKKTDDLGAMPYTFLGTASYVSHTGNKPMNVIWHLDYPVPAKYLKKTNKLLMG